MAELTIVADIVAETGSKAFVLDELKKLVAPTHAEDGCIRYDLHTDNENPAHFLFYETWSSRELWQAHMASAHLKALLQATEGKIASMSVYEMTRVS